MSGVRCMIALAAVFLFAVAPLRAQWDPAPFAPWTYADQQQHVAAGAALDLVVRGPWIAKSWRDRAWKRVAWVAVIGASYEMLQLFEARQSGNRGPGYGFGPADLACDVLGAVAMEFVDAIVP